MKCRAKDSKTKETFDFVRHERAGSVTIKHHDKSHLTVSQKEFEAGYEILPEKEKEKN